MISGFGERYVIVMVTVRCLDKFQVLLSRAHVRCDYLANGLTFLRSYADGEGVENVA